MTPRRRAIELLLSTCTVGAVFVLGSARLNAQTGFQGTPTIVTGEVTITSAGGHDDIQISNTQIAVIDWRPTGNGPGPIDFLPATNSVRYVGDGFNPSGIYTVLNRIFPGEPATIMLNGAISSQVAYTGQPTTGGSIWFYTPGGFMVGSTATFNVGGLVLSANNIPLDANNGFNPNVVRFVGAAGNTAGVSVLKGAQINATNYVALIAPKIVQSGSIRSDGQIAYIAAETGTLTMPLGGGLFSIAIDADGGTTVGGTAIDHDGSTGGPVNTGSTLNKRVYMVTVAKNNAVTMLLGGTIGYDLSAAAVGNAVVLSAGRDVVNGDAVLTDASAGPAASIQLVNATVTNPLTASASGDITLLAQGGGTLSVLGDTLAVADGTATARAAAGSTINMSGNLTVQSARPGLTAGTAQVIADTGGQINVKGLLSVLADGDGTRRGFISGDATGGTAIVSSDGGSISSNGLIVSATAVGYQQGSAPVAPTSQGGTASVLLTNGATLNTGPLTVNASASIGNGGGGTATGGAVSVAANGARINAGTTTMLADGNTTGAGGTLSLAAADGAPGSGTVTLGDTRMSANGGTAGRITLSNASSAISPAIRLASLNAIASGTPAAGGAGFALSALGNRIAVTGNALITTGGDQTYAASGTGGFDVGGTLTINAGGAVSLMHANGGGVDTVNGGDVAATGQSITVGPDAILGAVRTMTLTAVNGIDAANLRAGTSIDGTAGGAVTLGNVTVTAPAQANGGGLDTSVGRISFVAGANGGASYRAFDLTVTGRLSANALIDLTAGQDVRIGAAGQLTSANRVRIAAGDDVLVAPGGVIAAGQAPLGGNPLNAGLDLTAGQLTLVTPPPVGNVAAIIANGSLSSGASAMRLLGGALVVTGPITAGSLTVDIAGTASGSDGGQLSGTCQGRDICLDSVAVSGNAAIGQGGSGTPGNVGVASGTVGGTMLVNATTGIRLGRTAAAASLSAGGATRLVSGGTIDLLGTLTFSSTGALGLRAGGGITGATSTVRSNGDVALTTGGNLNLASLTAGGAFTGADANGLASGLPRVAGSATLGTLEVNGGDINLTVPGGITIGQVFVSEGRLVRLDAQAAALRVTNITGGTLGVAGSITLNGGSITADWLQARGAVGMTATGAVAVTTDVAASSVSATGSSVLLNALGPLTITSVVATNGDVTATSGGDLTVTTGQASGAIALTSGGGIAADRLRAGSAASLTGTGAVMVTTDIAATSVAARGSSVALNALGPLAITSIIATNGDAAARSGGNLSVALGQASGGITLTSGGGITADRLQAGNAAKLAATGAVAVNTDIAAGSVSARGSSVLLNASGPLAITSIVATNGDATATSGGDLSVAAGQATGAVTLTSQRTATFNGAIMAGTALNVTGAGIVANSSLRAPQIALRSAAMQIGAAAQIGVAGLTQNVGFTNTGAGPSFIGGAGGAGYSLTNTGLGRVQSRDIAIVLPRDVTVGDLALSGTLNLGGTLAINAPGTITVNGAVGLTNAAAANAITFNAGPAIRVVTPTGSIAMRSAAGTPAGTLTLNAATVAVGSQAALTDIAAANVPARNARLAINDGPVNDQGYLVAGTMRLAVSTGLYIQNSGANSPQLTGRRGFTVGDGGLTISTLGGQPVGIVINGRQILADGTIIGGAPLIPRITLNGAAGGAALFDPQSTVNGCRIIPGVCPNDNTTPKTLGGIRDSIGLLDGGPRPGVSPAVAAAAVNGVIPPIIIPAIGIEGLDPYSVEPPIDEPVVGIGNEDTWSDGKQAP